MAIQRANRAERLYESVWLRCGGDPLERILRRVDSWGGSAICPLSLPGRTSSAAEVAFELTLLPTLAKRERSIAFSWRHHWGTPLPSLFGTITVSRFGPFVNLLVSAEYAYGSDAASRLAHEAVGERYASISVQCLLQLLRSLFTSARPRLQRAS
jgi:hypothetical protein